MTAHPRTATAAATPAGLSFEDDLAATRALERSESPGDMVAHWEALHQRHPEEALALRFLIRGLERAKRHNDALLHLIDLPTRSATPEARQRAAECFGEIRDLDTASELFTELLEHDPGNARIRAVYAKYLLTKGDPLAAHDLLSAVHPEELSPTAEQLLFQCDSAIAAMEAALPGAVAALPNPALVLRAAILTFAERVPRPTEDGRIGRIALFTGSLGAGGAERQMSRIAAMLEERRRFGHTVAGRRIDGPIDVFVNSLDPGRGKDFFEADLRAADLAVRVTRDLPRTDIREVRTGSATLDDLLPLLPAHARGGMERLFAALRADQPDVAYIWQDGAVLTGALAALAAGVPRITVSLRGLPPNIRTHLMKPEYRDMYQALAEVPGVGFSCNSRKAALAYADWLDLPPDRFEVIYNALDALPAEPAPDDAALWDAFEAATETATTTIGGVFRFNENKRPLFWLDCARAALDRHPGLRFVLVGDGEDLATAQAHAETLGIPDRVLFVGRSASMGFWYRRLDVLMHLAREEGLPNVVMEAQSLGIPVVATPAGGTEEALEDGRTGRLLPSATSPETAEVVATLSDLLADPAFAEIPDRARAFAGDRFDRGKVLARTVDLLDRRLPLPLRLTSAEAAQPGNAAPQTPPSHALPLDPEDRDAYNIFRVA